MKRFEKELFDQAKSEVPDVFERVIAAKGMPKRVKPSPLKRLNYRLLTALVLGPLLLLGFFLLNPAQDVAASSVTLDFDTAIRLDLNEDGEVIDVIGVNAEGVRFADTLKDTLDWEGQTLSTVLPQLWAQASFDNRIEPESTVVFDVMAGEAHVQDALRAEMIYHFETVKQSTERPFADVIEVPSEAIQSGDETTSMMYDISPAKARLIQQIIDTDSGQTIETLQTLSHRELIGTYRSLNLRPNNSASTYMPPTDEERLESELTERLETIECTQAESLARLEAEKAALANQTGAAVEAQIADINAQIETVINNTDDALNAVQETFNEEASDARSEAQDRLDAIADMIAEKRSDNNAMREDMLDDMPGKPENPGMNPGHSDDDTATDDESGEETDDESSDPSEDTTDKAGDDESSDTDSPGARPETPGMSPGHSEDDTESDGETNEPSPNESSGRPTDEKSESDDPMIPGNSPENNSPENRPTPPNQPSDPVSDDPEDTDSTNDETPGQRPSDPPGKPANDEDAETADDNDTETPEMNPPSNRPDSRPTNPPNSGDEDDEADTEEDTK